MSAGTCKQCVRACECTCQLGLASSACVHVNANVSWSGIKCWGPKTACSYTSCVLVPIAHNRTHCTHIAVLYCTVLCCNMRFCTVLYCLNCPALSCTAIYCPVLSILCCSVLYCTVLHGTDSGHTHCSWLEEWAGLVPGCRPRVCGLL